MEYENVLLIGYLTDENDTPTRPVIGMPFIPRTLRFPFTGERDLFRHEVYERLGVSEFETNFYELTTNGKKSKDFSLVVLKPGFREQVREVLRGGIVWVSTGGLEEHLDVMKRDRARLYRSFIISAGNHDSIMPFVDILKTSRVGT